MQLAGTAWDDCNKAIEAGLSAPPGYTKRDFVHVSLRLRTRQLLVEDTTSIGMKSTMTKPADSLSNKALVFSVLRIAFMWLFWFLVFTMIITQWRKMRRHLLVYRLDWCSSPRRLCFSTLPIVSIVITAWAVIIMIENVRWIESKQHEAGMAWQARCGRLSVCPFTCLYCANR